MGLILARMLSALMAKWLARFERFFRTSRW
jgi:hypothetical protein